jgi:hypothetical protein
MQRQVESLCVEVRETCRPPLSVEGPSHRRSSSCAGCRARGLFGYAIAVGRGLHADLGFVVTTPMSCTGGTVWMDSALAAVVDTRAGELSDAGTNSASRYAGWGYGVIGMRQLRRTCTVLLFTVMAACGGHAAPPITALVPTLAPTTTTTAPTGTTATSAADSISPVTSATAPPGSTSAVTVTVATAELLPPTVGTKVTSAPGVTSPGDIRELMPKMWAFIPSAPDPNDAHVQPPLPGDIEIIAAYLEERTALHELTTQHPTPGEPSPRLVASRLDGAASIAETLLKPRSVSGVYRDLAEGFLLRPIVIATPRSDTEAFIFDCQLDASVLRNADGSLVEGETPGVKQVPQLARLVKQDGRWLVATATTDDRACS